MVGGGNEASYLFRHNDIMVSWSNFVRCAYISHSRLAGLPEKTLQTAYDGDDSDLGFCLRASCAGLARNLGKASCAHCYCLSSAGGSGGERSLGSEGCRGVWRMLRPDGDVSRSVDGLGSANCRAGAAARSEDAARRVCAGGTSAESGCGQRGLAVRLST